LTPQNVGFLIRVHQRTLHHLGPFCCCLHGRRVSVKSR
jgi:hypothetical protein